MNARPQAAPDRARSLGAGRRENEPSRALAFFLGRWSASRRIVDHRAGSIASFEGEIVITGTSDRGRATFTEEGVLSVGAHRGPASRSLEYRGCDDGTIDVHFSDGRFFFNLDLRDGRSTAVHLCGEDRYEIETIVVDLDRLEERWRVFGPTKDYGASTIWVRCVSDGTC